MVWIFLSLIYALTNALYISFNETHKYNGYVLGIWQGFGISFLISPLLLTTTPQSSISYYIILILQGILIGIYDSHIFFSSSQYGSNASSGFMATSVLISLFLWWFISYEELNYLMQQKEKLLSITLFLSFFCLSYWQMMKVHINTKAERYLYPASFSLALMSIATRYIAINGGNLYTGVVYYLVVSCFISGLYNALLFIKTPLNPKRFHKIQLLKAPLKNKNIFWLLCFSSILITAKTLALRFAPNPSYVIALLLLTPYFSSLIKRQSPFYRPFAKQTLFFLILFLIAISYFN